MILFNVFWLLLILAFFLAAKFLLSGLSEKKFIEVMSNPIFVRHRSRSLKTAEIVVLMACIVLTPVMAGFFYRLAIQLQEYVFGNEDFTFFAGREALWAVFTMVSIGFSILLMIFAGTRGAPIHENDWQRQPMLWEALQRCRKMKYFGLGVAFLLQLMFMYNVTGYTKFNESKIAHRAKNLKAARYFDFKDLEKIEYVEKGKGQKEDFIITLNELEISLWDTEINPRMNYDRLEGFVVFLKKVGEKRNLSFEIENWPPKES